MLHETLLVTGSRLMQKFKLEGMKLMRTLDDVESGFRWLSQITSVTTKHECDEVCGQRLSWLITC